LPTICVLTELCSCNNTYTACWLRSKLLLLLRRNNTVNISNSYTKSCSSSGKTSVYFAYNMCFDRAVQLQQHIHSMLATIKTTVATTSATPITITTDDVSEIIV